MATSKMLSRVWRESASLILFDVLRDRPRVLMVQRGRSSKFMANAVVFPGGVLDNHDYNQINDNNDLSHILDTREAAIGEESLIIRSERCGPLQKSLALRKCAIRETFEETGFLLAGNKDEKNDNNNDDNNYERRKSDKSYHGDVIAESWSWKDRVRDDARLFDIMLEQLKLRPKIGELRGWSQWLTPWSRGSRFHTIFFLAQINNDELVRVHEKFLSENQRNDEIALTKWMEIDEILQIVNNNPSNEQWLPPPQVYELCRLRTLLGKRSLESLLSDFELRKMLMKPVMMPVFYSCTDGLVGVLPKDELYPIDIDLVGSKDKKEGRKLNMTVEEFNDKWPRANRMIGRKEGVGNSRVYVTINL